MFQALNAASAPNKYQITWCELSSAEFSLKITAWLSHLSGIFSGPSASKRAELAEEFYRLLHIYKQLLEKDPRFGLASPHVTTAKTNITTFATKYREKFKSELKPLPPTLPADLSSFAGEMGVLTAKRTVVQRKKQAVQYWLNGVRHFNPHKEDVSLTFQYLGNAEAAKVRLFLDVLMKDADKLLTMSDPRPALKVSGSASAGLDTVGENGRLTSVTWTNEEFKKAIKAEFGASYGVRASGSCELEITGLRAELKAEVFAGAAVSGEFEATRSIGRGIEVTGKVDAMLGIKIKLDANIDVADIFLAEASAEAFAGAMANAEVEIKATVGGVSFKLGAEAFAGARVKGSAGLTLRMCGYDIIKGEAEGYLSAGVGAEFKLEVSASVFDGASFSIAAGTTLGVGMGGKASFKVYSDNLPRVANSLFYTAYLTILGQSQKKHAWTTYFRNLEDNEILFSKADEMLDQLLLQLGQKEKAILSSKPTWKQLEELSVFQAPPLPKVLAVGPPAPLRRQNAVRRL